MTDTMGPKEVGDLCFLHYRKMLRAWRASPRWTTAHGLYRDFVMLPAAGGNSAGVNVAQHEYENYINDRAACELAWQVFFQLHVAPYELGKRTLNGEIDY